MKIIITEQQLNSIKMNKYCKLVLQQMIDNTEWRDASFSVIELDGKNVSTALNHNMDYPYYSYMPDGVADYMTMMGLPEECDNFVWDNYSNHVIKMYLNKKRG